MDYEYKIDVAGVEYSQEDGFLISGSMHQPLFDKFGAGNACVSELDISFYPSENPPRMAPITVFSRIFGGNEWTQLGKFYTDTRKTEKFHGGEVLHIHAYDAMLKAEQIYLQDEDVDVWPKTMPEVVEDICQKIGVPLDGRTVLDSAYMVPYPNDYTMREILCHVAAAHAGNWIITKDEKLLLVPLFAEKPTFAGVLGTDDGKAIVFGKGVMLLV